MPVVTEVLLDPVSLIIFGIYAVLMLYEAIFPARTLPYVRHWRIKGMVSFLIYFLISVYLPILYASWMPTSQIFNLREINVFAGAFAAILLYEFGLYLWHRALHKSDRLWKVFHQMHHSAERLDTYGAFYFSPFDSIGWTLLATVCFSFVAGLPPLSITIMLITASFFSMFQHANIKTPAWLGYLVQRPESHAVHHQRDVHAFNYSDLPIFDIISGTFKNPKEYISETGFYPGASSRIKEMLLFREIDKP